MLRDQQSCSVERGDKMCSVSCSSPAPFIIAVFGSGTEDKCVKTAFIMCSTGKNTLRYEMLESFSVHLLWLQCFSRKELFLWLSKLSQACVKYLSLSIHQSCCSLEVCRNYLQCYKPTTGVCKCVMEHTSLQSVIPPFQRSCWANLSQATIKVNHTCVIM